MKIAFVQPKSFHTWEALNIGYLASSLKLNGFSNLLFFSGFFDKDEETIRECREADIIGFSCTSPQMKHALQLAKQIKKTNNWIVFGGVHPSSLPEDTLKYEFIDAVVVGEGEQAIVEIAKGNRKKIIKMPYIQNLDNIPFPDRIFIKQERNIQQAFYENNLRIGSIFSSRGCPFRCRFCASNQVWSRIVRFRSPENILNEFIKLVDDYKIDFVKFSDDTFTLKRDLVMDFCRRKIEKNVKTKWGCNIRVNTVDREILELMRKANCTEVWAGVESGSPNILKDMQKDITINQVKEIFKITKDLGFFRRAYILLGMPNENYKDIKMTEELIDEIKPDYVGFTILASYPGTEFYNHKQYANTDWSLVDEYENRLTNTRYLSNEDLHREQKRLITKYQRIITFRQKIK